MVLRVGSERKFLGYKWQRRLDYRTWGDSGFRRKSTPYQARRQFPRERTANPLLEFLLDRAPTSSNSWSQLDVNDRSAVSLN